MYTHFLRSELELTINPQLTRKSVDKTIDSKLSTEITPSRFITQMENMGYGIGFTKHGLCENHALREKHKIVTKA